MASDFRGQSNLSLALRNNNPGNIRPGQNFQGEVSANEGFSVFQDISWGIRAWAIVYHTYITKDEVKDITGYINRYAPPSDHNPNNANYIAAICSGTGLLPTDPLPTDQDTVSKFFTAQVNFETGNEVHYIQATDIEAGFDLFNQVHPGFFQKSAA